MKIKNIIPIGIFLLGCNSPNPNEKKIIDTGKFEIEVPGDWEYVKKKGIDSFIGGIGNEEVRLNFDYSEYGYASQLVLTTEEFLNKGSWKWSMNAPYMKRGVTYTTGDIDKERKAIMEKKGITDPTLVKVENFQTPKTELLFEEGRYKAILTYRDTFEEVDIEIPEDTKKHQFQIDTIDGYYRKIIWPQNGSTGMTGIYFQDLNSRFNFQLNGTGLSPENQQKAIAAFKTIKMKSI